MYFVGDRPRSWVWCGGADDHDKEGEGGASEGEQMNKLFVGMGHSGVRICWDCEPELPSIKMNESE